MSQKDSHFVKFMSLAIDCQYFPPDQTVTFPAEERYCHLPGTKKEQIIRFDDRHKKIK